MSILFQPLNIKQLQISNRFIHSATFEGMSPLSGEVTQEHLNRYRKLARGQVGLIIPGYMFVHELGRASPTQTGIHNDSLIPGLRRLTETIHKEGGKVAFQLAHAGRQSNKSTIKTAALAPSPGPSDNMFSGTKREMSVDEIKETIIHFKEAARRAVEAGADGVQLHCAHGYLINQFLSPYTNHRTDDWGGTPENRFRFLKEIILAIRPVLPPGMPLMVKINSSDYIPEGGGIDFELARDFARRLAELKIDAVEVSSGTIAFSFMHITMGELPVQEFCAGLPWWKRPFARYALNKIKDNFGLKEGYNMGGAQVMRPILGDIPIFLVGGMRTVSYMEEVLKGGYADCVSLSRPFIREPALVKMIRDHNQTEVTCKSCNGCLMEIQYLRPVRCTSKGKD